MMKTNGLVIFMGACLLACADAPLDVPASAEAATATRAAPPAVEDVTVQDVRSMLQVRHSKDLPRRKAIRAMPGAEQALRDIVQNDDAAVMRTRAAKLLGHFDSSESFLVSVLSDDTQLDSVRAGAIVCAPSSPHRISSGTRRPPSNGCPLKPRSPPRRS